MSCRLLQAHFNTPQHCTAVTRYKNRCMQSTAQEICWELHDKLIPLQLPCFEPAYWVTGLVLLFIFCFGPLTGEINESVKAEYTDQCTCS